MIFGYVRAMSKTEINKNIIQDLANQIIKEYKDVEIVYEEFNSDFYSLQNLIKHLKPNDVVVINGLERLGRDIDGAIKNISSIIECGAELHILRYIYINKDNYNEIINIINITEKAKEQMYKERRSLSTINSKSISEKKQGKPSINLDADKIHTLLKDYTQQEVAKILGVSRSTITRFLRKEKI